MTVSMAAFVLRTFNDCAVRCIITAYIRPMMRFSMPQSTHKFYDIELCVGCGVTINIIPMVGQRDPEPLSRFYDVVVGCGVTINIIPMIWSARTSDHCQFITVRKTGYSLLTCIRVAARVPTPSPHSDCHTPRQKPFYPFSGF